MDPHRDEVDQNFDVFKQLLPSLMEHSGKYALLRHGKLVTVYDTLEDALRTAESIYGDGLYSIQRVTDKPVDLGFRSRAMLRG